MVLSLRSDGLTYNPSFSTINCDKAECLAPVAHVQSYSSKSQVLVPQLLIWGFFVIFSFSLRGVGVDELAEFCECTGGEDKWWGWRLENVGR